MTVKELMERVPTINEGYAIAYINDAVKELSTMSDDNISFTTATITKDIRFYDPPATMLKLKSVYILDTSVDPNQYRKIPRTHDISTQDDD